jgi:hypothetical protein
MVELNVLGTDVSVPVFRFHQEIEAKIAASGIPAAVLGRPPADDRGVARGKQGRLRRIAGTGPFSVYQKSTNSFRRWVNHLPFGIFLGLYGTGGGSPLS